MALVTGSSMGIGNALARGLAQAGARVVVNGRNAERLAQAAQALRDEGHEGYELPFDACDAAAAAEAVNRFQREEGPINIVVNNAGMQHRAPLEDFPTDDFDRLMRTVNWHTLYVDGGITASL